MRLSRVWLCVEHHADHLSCRKETHDRGDEDLLIWIAIDSFWFSRSVVRLVGELLNMFHLHSDSLYFHLIWLKYMSTSWKKCRIYVIVISCFSYQWVDLFLHSRYLKLQITLLKFPRKLKRNTPILPYTILKRILSPEGDLLFLIHAALVWVSKESQRIIIYFMCVTKDAVVIILDVGPSMCQAPPGHSTSLEISVKAVNMIIQRKVRINLCSTYRPLVVVSILCGLCTNLKPPFPLMHSKLQPFWWPWQPKFQLKKDDQQTKKNWKVYQCLVKLLNVQTLVMQHEISSQWYDDFFISMVTILQLKLVKRQLFEKGNLEPFLTKGTWDTCIYSVGMFKNWGKWSILCTIFQVIFHWKQSPYSYFSFQMFANTKDEFALVLFGTEGMCMLQFNFLIS